MTKTYTKEEIKEFLKNRYNAESVIQCDDDYENEFHIFTKYDDVFCDIHVEVVNTLTALKNEADFGEAKQFLLNTVEALLNQEELLEIGAYKKLADDLYCREF